MLCYGLLSSPEITGTFFCPEKQEQMFRKVPVISIVSDEYYIPGLYFIPEFDVSSMFVWL